MNLNRSNNRVQILFVMVKGDVDGDTGLKEEPGLGKGSKSDQKKKIQ